MFIKLFILLVLLHSIIENNQSAEILLLSPLIYNKNIYYILQPLIKSLLDKGHNITTVTAIDFPYHKNMQQILIKESFDYATMEDHSYIDDPRNKLLLTSEAGYMMSEEIFTNNEFQTLLLSDKKYDLVISTDLPTCYSISVIEYRFKAHGVSILNDGSASQVYWILGEHFNPAYQPEINIGLEDVEQMTFNQRLYNVYLTGMTLFLTYSWILPLHESLLDSFSDDLPFLKDRPSLSDIISNKSLILVPTHHTVENIYLHSPRTRHIAGINIEKNKPLPKVFENFMASSQEVILVTSDLSTLNVQTVRKFEHILLSVFGRLMQNVIWKHKMNTTLTIPPNVMLVDWLPQQDILAHKNLKLFINHGSLNSITEATYYGIPLIITPFHLEQYKNVKKIFKSGAGIILDTEHFTVESIMEAINEIKNHHKYRESALRRSTIFKDRLQNPLEEAVYWIEYILQHGNILKPATSSMPQYQVLLLDILALIIVTIIIVFYLCKISLKFIYKKTIKLVHHFQRNSNKKNY